MTTPAPSFTPEPWIAGDENEYSCSIDCGNGRTSISFDRYDSLKRQDLHISRDEMLANRRLVKSAPSLYAYAKAFELLHAWINVPDDEDDAPALDKYSQHLVSMGMGVSEDADEFLETYRAAALAQAEGRNP